jgi:hypothetical protein
MKAVKYTSIVAVLSMIIMVGCVKQEPVWGPVPGPSGEPVQIGETTTVDPKLQEVADKVMAAHDGTAALNPYAVFTGPVVQGFFGLLLAASTLVAGIKNRNKAIALKTITAGVESAEGSDEVKAAIGKIADLTGTSAVTKAVVNSIKQ